MLELLIPPFIFFVGALLVPLIPTGIARGVVTLFVPAAAAGVLWHVGLGNFFQVTFYGLELELMRVDELSRIFALVFCLAAFLAAIYAWHLKDTIQQVATLFYAGSAVGAALAGDLITFFFYWEGTAIASVFLIWARGTEGAYWTGLRYLAVQIGSGVILIAGVVLFYFETGSIAFDTMTLGSIATWMIFVALGIKCAFPFFHSWLLDSYPAGTITGTVILSAFTTKLAIYALARGFAGTELLIYIGAVMAVLPAFFALVENDLRRVLCHAVLVQLGFMVVGVGLGTELALYGVAGHAVVHILYKSLLFMAIGAVMFRTGSAKATDLGGLNRTMPWTTLFCVIGAISSAAFPLFSGFVTKTMILDEAAKAQYQLVWVALVFAGAAVLAHSGLRVPLKAFFSKDSGKRPSEAPPHMLWAMGLTAGLCLVIGIFPNLLYAQISPNLDYNAYTLGHIVGQVQLLLFALLAYALFALTGLMPEERKGILLDFDWTYRKLGAFLLAKTSALVSAVWGGVVDFLMRTYQNFVDGLMHTHGPEGRMAREWPTGAMVLSIALLLALTLVVNFV